MVEIAHVQCVIAPITIRIHNAVRRYLPGNERHYGCGLGFVHFLGKYLASTLQYSEYGYLASSTPTPFAFTNTTKIAFIQLYCTIKYFSRLKLYMMAYYLPNLPVEQHRCIRLNLQYVSR